MDIQKSDTVISEKGVTFTATSVDEMRKFLRAIRVPTQNSPRCNAMTWTVQSHDDGGLRADLVAYLDAGPPMIEDRVMDVRFYWLALPEDWEAIKTYCIDLPSSGPTRLIPL